MKNKDFQNGIDWGKKIANKNFNDSAMYSINKNKKIIDTVMDYASNKKLKKTKTGLTLDSKQRDFYTGVGISLMEYNNKLELNYNVSKMKDIEKKNKKVKK